MSELSSLGYVVLNVSDLAAWEQFATQILGVMVGRRYDDAIGLRLDEYAQRILLEHGSADDIAAAGWQFDTAAELRDFVERVRGNGVEVIAGLQGISQAPLRREPFHLR